MIRRIRAEKPPVASGLTPEEALDNLRSGLDFFFGETSAADLAAQMDVERSRIHELRDAIAARLEAEFAVLDALSPDPDFEDGADDEPSLASINPPGPHLDGALDPLMPVDTRGDQRLWSTGSTDDREDGEDSGMADGGGYAEQVWRFTDAGGDINRVRRA